MKKYKTKTAAFLAGKGFYLILGLCMVAIGFAAYSAMDSMRMDETEKKGGNNSLISSYNNSSEQELPKAEVQQPVANQSSSVEETVSVDTVVAAEYFTLPFEGNIAKGYSSELLQYSETYGDMRLHTGIDIIPSGSLVVQSCGAGVVASIDEKTVFGTVITVDHGNGVFIRYCGVKNIKVQKDDVLEAGTAIAELGVVTNECAEEAHLHLEVLKDGEAVSPESIFAQN